MALVVDPEKLLEAYELRAEGLNYNQIAERIGRSNSQVRQWIKTPELFSPYLDEIALERALAGDRTAFRNLSHCETLEFYSRAAKLVDEDLRTAHYNEDTSAAVSWLTEIADKLGENRDNIASKIGRARARN